MEEKEERFVYIIAELPEGPTKIGVANDPQSRLQQLQTGSAVTLKLFNAEPCLATHALSLERMIHQQLAHKRLRGEWFDIDVESAAMEVRFGIIRWESDDTLDRAIRRKAALTRAKRDLKP